MRNKINQGPEQPQRRTPSAKALSASRNKRVGQNCSFRAPHGKISGHCRAIPGGIGCEPRHHR